MLWTAGVTRTVLANGLTVVVQPVRGAPAAAIVTRVRAGFFDEPDHWGGISHVLEHMFFKGTPTRGVGEIARATKAAGGYLNAATSYDYTAYYAVLPARGLATAMAIQADALQNALIDRDELRREIRVIIEEAKRKQDTPSAVAQETLHALLFDQHRIRRWRIGTEPVLRSFTRDDLVGYYRSRYVPSRSIVSLAGGIDPEEALALVNQWYGDWEPGVAGTDRSPEEPSRRGRRAATLRGDVRQSDLIVGWRGVPALDPDELPLDLAAAVLSAGRAGWLYRALRDTGIAASVGAYNYSPTEVGVFAISADLDPTRGDDALAAIAGEVGRLRDRGPSEEELARARTMLRARWARRFESAEGRASELAAAESLGGVALLEHDYDRLLRLGAVEVRDAARRHLDPAAVAAVVYHPRNAGEDLTAEHLDKAFSRPGPPPRPPRVTPRVAVPRPRAMPARSAAPVTHVALPGVDLLLRRREGVPTVTVGVYRLRTAAEAPDQAGLGALSVRSAIRGAGVFEGSLLAEAIERLGGAISPAVTADWFGYQGSVLAEHLVEAAVLLDEVLRAPTNSDQAIAIERGLLADDARQLADDMFRYPVQLAFRAAFGGAGYGLPVLGLPETVEGLTASDVRRWHQAMLARGRTTVVAVGDLELEAAAAALAGHFESAPAAVETRATLGALRDDLVAPLVTAEARDKAQTALAMFFPGPSRRSPERHAVEVWASIAGGLGGRLFESLRDRRSLAYTVAATPWQRRSTGALLTYIATSPEREAEAREAMLVELERFRREPPEEVEVERAINYLTGQLEVSRQSAGAVAGEILDAWLQGEGLQDLVDPLAPYRLVTPEMVLHAAERYLDVERRIEGVVRGTSRSAT
jgi:zinc protease